MTPQSETIEQRRARLMRIPVRGSPGGTLIPKAIPEPLRVEPWDVVEAVGLAKIGVCNRYLCERYGTTECVLLSRFREHEVEIKHRR